MIVRCPLPIQNRAWVVVNLRGSGGSGKSYVARALIEQLHGQPIKNQEGKTEGYKLDHNIYVVGRYETPCGGCDTIKTREEVIGRVRRYARLGNVFFEGYVVSKTYSTYVELDRSLGGMIWAFLDTPLEVCIERIYQRRGGEKTRLIKNAEVSYAFVVRSREKAISDGLNVWDIPYQNSVDAVLGLFRLSGD